jgi:uncharacterized RDD family membrane protein YckC
LESPQQPGGPAGPEMPPGATGAPPPAPQAPPPPPPQQPAGPSQPPGTFRGVELADWGPRALAILLDGLVGLGVTLVVFAPGTIVAIATEGGVTGWVLLGVGGLVWLAFSILYAPYFMRRPGERNGQTLGKQWMSVRVVKDDGQPFGWAWGFLRELVIKGIALSVASSIASGVTFFLLGAGAIAPYLLDYLWPLWDDENRALHDMVAKTHVVKA